MAVALRKTRKSYVHTAALFIVAKGKSYTMKKTDSKSVDKQVRYSAFKVQWPKWPNDRPFSLSDQTISLMAVIVAQRDA